MHAAIIPLIHHPPSRDQMNQNIAPYATRTPSRPTTALFWAIVSSSTSDCFPTHREIVYIGRWTRRGTRKSGSRIRAERVSRIKTRKVVIREGNGVGLLGSRLRGNGRRASVSLVKFAVLRRERYVKSALFSSRYDSSVE